MTGSEEIARRYYRLGLAAAKRRDLTAALRFASLACVLNPEDDGDDSCLEDATRLEEICRSELGDAREPAFEQIRLLVKQKKWAAAARATGTVSDQSVLLLNIQGCLWALAGRYAPAMDSFGKALAKDRGSILAADALAEIGRRRKSFWRFFVSL